MNTIVQWTLAKLLKEKQFNEECAFIYSAMEGEEGKLIPVTSSLDHVKEFGKKGYKFFDDPNKTRIHHTLRNDYAEATITAPTIADVVMWLYEKHGIWINIDIVLDNRWFYKIKKIELLGYTELYGSHLLSTHPESPTEAYEAAIEYSLTNLIKL